MLLQRLEKSTPGTYSSPDSTANFPSCHLRASCCTCSQSSRHCSTRSPIPVTSIFTSQFNKRGKNPVWEYGNVKEKVAAGAILPSKLAASKTALHQAWCLEIKYYTVKCCNAECCNAQIPLVTLSLQALAKTQEMSLDKVMQKSCAD